jgi:hypothetical protein
MAFDSIPGAHLTEAELDDLIAHGWIKICSDGSIPVEGLLVARNWITSQRHDLDDWDGAPTRPVPFHERKDNLSAPSGWTSGDPSNRLDELTKQRMKSKGIDYITALNEVQKEYPDLARQVAAGLDAYRHRNKPDRLR